MLIAIVATVIICIATPTFLMNMHKLYQIDNDILIEIILINTCTQRPFAQVNSSDLHVLLQKISSDRSEQSGFWSQTQDIGIHSPSELLHVNSSGVQTCFSIEKILITLLFPMLNIYKRKQMKQNVNDIPINSVQKLS